MNALTHVYNILSNVQKLAKTIYGVKFYPFQLLYPTGGYPITSKELGCELGILKKIISSTKAKNNY